MRGGDHSKPGDARESVPRHDVPRDQHLQQYPHRLRPFAARNLHYGGATVETFRGTGTCLGDLIQAVRAVVGPAVPIAVTLDFHGNLSEEMARGADLLHGYKTYPHVDMAERGVEATERLL